MKLDIDKYRLSHNPCQGCEAYYPNRNEGCRCQVEIDGVCGWIVIYDAAVAEESGK